MDINKIVSRFVSISISILISLLVIIGLIRLGEFCYDFGYRVFTEPAMEEEPGTDVTVVITDDMSEYAVGSSLLEKGLIRDKNLFYVQLKLSAYSGKLREGTYTLNTSMTARDMMEVMAAKVEKAEETETESEEASEDIQETEDTQETKEAGAEE